jgi:hypothetical protein
MFPGPIFAKKWSASRVKDICCEIHAGIWRGRNEAIERHYGKRFPGCAEKREAMDLR